MNERSLFLAALDISDPAARAAYLDEACGGDVDLRRRLDDLLRAHAAPGGLPGVALPPTEDHPPPGEQPGMMIGPYKLMEQIGEGGMGVVFVAEQQEPVRRKVALKVIKPGMDTRDVIARFEAERQALALMDHPHIAKVFDAGATPSGRPYFVMELIKGVAITDYCDQIQLTPRERLGLFVSVCQAVQHAHTKGIIHRDLKPSNILVTLHDGTPMAKVIDFGVAKAIGQHLTEKTIYTRFNQMIGTPLYMSPEQAQMSALDVDTRTDVYALGVLLYELLTGTTPFDRERFRKAALDEICRIIREEDPPKPSTRLSSLGGTLSAVSARRKTEPRKLSALVRGELDWVVMKALEKDRTRRYETASAFAADVQKFLNLEPVDAGPPGAWYRFRKFTRRNQAMATTVALVAAALLLGTGVSVWQALRAWDAEAEASRNEEDAKTNAARARANETEARRNLEKANETGEKLRRSLYAAQINLIPAAWENNNIFAVLELLEQTRPKPGEEDLRGFEWHYWNRQCHAELRTIHLDGGLYTAKAAGDKKKWGYTTFSPDATHLVSLVGNEDPKLRPKGSRTVKVWNTANGRVVFSQDFDNLDSPEFSLSAGGKRLAIRNRPFRGTGFVSVWDVAKSTQLLNIEGNIRAWQMSADAERIAVFGSFGAKPSTEDPGQVNVWRIASGKALVLKSDSWTDRTELSFSPDSSRLAVTSGGRTRIFDADSGKDLVTMQGEWPDPSKLAFSPDGSRLAAWRSPNTRIWDASSGKHLFDVAKCHHLTFSADGKTITAIMRLDTKGCDWSCRTLDAATGKELRSIQFEDGPEALLAFYFESQRLVGLVTPLVPCICDPDTGKQLLTFKGHTGSIHATALSSDGKHLFSIDEFGTLKQWDARTAEERSKQENAERKLDPGAITILSADGLLEAVCSDQHSVVSIRDIAGKELCKFKEHPGHPWPLQFSPGGRYVISGASVRNARTGEVCLTVRPMESRLVFNPLPQFSNDSSRLAFVDENGCCQVVQASDGKAVFSRKVQATFCYLSPDGRRLLSEQDAGEAGRTFRGTLKLWDVDKGTELLAIQDATVPEFDFLHAAAIFSTDGKRCAFHGPTAIVVVEAMTGVVLATFPFAREPNGMAFSPDGALLAVADVDRDALWGIVVFDIAAGKERCRLRGHVIDWLLANLSFSPDGKRIASLVTNVGASKIKMTLKLWDSATGSELLSLTASYGRDQYSPLMAFSKIAFTPDGHQLHLLNWWGSRVGSAPIWDATPLPEQ
jgi:serine/threonine protein kinase/WD40 repeat protein